MCIIVDANVVAQVLTESPSADFVPVWEAISDGKIVAVYGGHLT